MFDDKNPVGRTATSKLAAIWCEFMHDSPMWPIHGEYRCRTCGRRSPVEWAGSRVSTRMDPAAAHGPMQSFRSARMDPAAAREPMQSFRSALLPLILIAAALLPSRVRAAEALVTGSSHDAAIAFGRYIAGSSQNAPWDAEIIEIEASLPRLEKQGHLRAVRRLEPLGKPRYQGVEMAGDEIVKQQVIIRYLNAEAKAAEIPVASVAVTPVNYKFSFKGAHQTAGATIYYFSIRPRKKRPGLLKGELWLDQTGVVVRQSGYLVKSPSIFVKRITVTRETAIRDGLAEDRVTHVSVNTHLAGRAELTVHEHPCIDAACGAAQPVGE